MGRLASGPLWLAALAAVAPQATAQFLLQPGDDFGDSAREEDSQFFAGFGNNFGWPHLLNRGPSDAKTWSSSSSTSEVFENQGHSPGRFLARTRRCKNGHCVQETQRGKLPSHPAVDMKHEEVLPVRRRLPQLFGFGGMDRLFQHSSPFEGIPALVFGNSGKSDLLKLQRNEVAQEGKGTDYKAAGDSSSVETQMVNGHVVQRRSKCHNGKCATSVVESELKPPQPQRRVEVPIDISLMETA